MEVFFVGLFVFANQIGIIESNWYNGTRQLGFVSKGDGGRGGGGWGWSNLLTHNVLKQHLLEVGVISCFSNSYYEKFCKVLGEHV